MEPKDIGKMIRLYRKQSGLSQLALAQLARVGKTVIYDVEKGKMSVQLNTFIKILDVLNIHLQLNPPFPLPTNNETKKQEK